MSEQSVNDTDKNKILKLGEGKENEFKIEPLLYSKLLAMATERRTNVFHVILQAIATEVFLWEQLNNSNAKLFLEDDRTRKELKFKN